MRANNKIQYCSEHKIEKELNRVLDAVNQKKEAMKFYRNILRKQFPSESIKTLEVATEILLSLIDQKEVPELNKLHKIIHTPGNEETKPANSNTFTTNNEVWGTKDTTQPAQELLFEIARDIINYINNNGTNSEKKIDYSKLIKNINDRIDQYDKLVQEDELIEEIQILKANFVAPYNKDNNNIINNDNNNDNDNDSNIDINDNDSDNNIKVSDNNGNNGNNTSNTPNNNNDDKDIENIENIDFIVDSNNTNNSIKESNDSNSDNNNDSNGDNNKTDLNNFIKNLENKFKSNDLTELSKELPNLKKEFENLLDEDKEKFRKKAGEAEKGLRKYMNFIQNSITRRKNK